MDLRTMKVYIRVLQRNRNDRKSKCMCIYVCTEFITVDYGMWYDYSNNGCLLT